MLMNHIYRHTLPFKSEHFCKKKLCLNWHCMNCEFFQTNIYQFFCTIVALNLLYYMFLIIRLYVANNVNSLKLSPKKTFYYWKLEKRGALDCIFQDNICLSTFLRNRNNHFLSQKEKRAKRNCRLFHRKCSQEMKSKTKQIVGTG